MNEDAGISDRIGLMNGNANKKSVEDMNKAYSVTLFFYTVCAYHISNNIILRDKRYLAIVDAAGHPYWTPPSLATALRIDEIHSITLRSMKNGPNILHE